MIFSCRLLVTTSSPFLHLHHATFLPLLYVYACHRVFTPNFTILLYPILDLEWKVLYVGSAHDATKDQTLDEILVGPIPVGVNKFVLQADAPDPEQLPPDEILGVTVVLVTCSYREREFIRVGYYVNNEYMNPNPPPVVMGDDGEPLPPPPPPKYPQLDLNRVQRQILADKPRVTKFAIPWSEEEAERQKQAMQQQIQQPVTSGFTENEDPMMNKAMMTPSMESEASPGGAAPMETE